MGIDRHAADGIDDLSMIRQVSVMMMTMMMRVSVIMVSLRTSRAATA
jgi:hypothetical protein